MHRLLNPDVGKCTNCTYLQIHIHGDKMESLHKFLPADILPIDFGGKLPPLSSKVNIVI